MMMMVMMQMKAWVAKKIELLKVKRDEKVGIQSTEKKLNCPPNL